MFRDADQAIRFAFRMRDKSIVSKMRMLERDTPSSTATDRLTAYDFHAMSGMLFAFLMRCTKEQQAAVYLLYGNEYERKVAARIICYAEGVKLPKYITNRTQLRQALLSKTVRDCADKCGLTNYKAWKVRREMWNVVEPILWKLHEDLERWLKLEEAC